MLVEIYDNEKIEINFKEYLKYIKLLDKDFLHSKILKLCPSRYLLGQVKDYVTL